MRLPPPDRFFRGLAVALLAVAPHLHGQAQSRAQLVDPTRPPAAAEPGVVVPARLDTAAAPRAWPKLQSVQIPAHGEASAMVDGQIVRVGERIGEATLTAIDAQRIVLRTGRYEQHISLTPGITKTPIAIAAIPTKQPVVALAANKNR